MRLESFKLGDLSTLVSNIATETAQVACNNAYVDKNEDGTIFEIETGSTLTYEGYYMNNRYILDTQLALAGLRLAKFLNSIFATAGDI